MIPSKALVVTILLLVALSTTVLGAAKHGGRQGRITLFNVVQFQNDPCTSSDPGITGTCFSESDCTSNGGSASGNCASGFGVCCVFTAQCGQTVTQNCTYVQNPSFPATDDLTDCEVDIEKLTDDICSIRIDFEDSNLPDPEPLDGAATEGDCASGGLQIASGSGRDPGFLCGDIADQHIYIDAGAGSVTSSLSITGTASFRYKITQLECRFAPPKGCDQYFTGLAGTVKSYNFNGGYHLDDQDYTICIRPEKGYCEITYTVNEENGVDGFGISKNNNNAMVGVSECDTEDRLEISNSRNIEFDEGSMQCMYSDGAADVPFNNADVFCGGSLNCVTNEGTSSTIISSDFSLQFISDSDEGTGADPGQGFCLNYKQLPCEC